MKLFTLACIGIAYASECVGVYNNLTDAHTLIAEDLVDFQNMGAKTYTDSLVWDRVISVSESCGDTTRTYVTLRVAGIDSGTDYWMSERAKWYILRYKYDGDWSIEIENPSEVKSISTEYKIVVQTIR